MSLRAKYFVAHLLTGNVKRYHGALTRELSKRFRIFPLHERVEPHITIKAPFEADEDGIAEVERVLRAFAHSQTVVPFTVRGFGRFGFRTVYLDVDRGSRAVLLVRRAIQELNAAIPWMTKAPLEGNKLHASVARFMDRVQSRRVLRFLKPYTPQFETVLDNITILKKEGNRWKTVTTIPLREEPVTYLAPFVEELVETT